MSKRILVIPDQHAHPEHNNDRADWLSEFIIDTKPDIVVNMGDAADMASLSSYDKGKRSFVNRNYRADIEAHLDFQERVWEPVKRQKKKLPYRVVLEGNHEARIERALDLSPELQGTMGFEDYAFDRYYDDVIRYEGGTPGVIEIEKILFAHYLITGVSGRPIGGERAGHMLISKYNQSCVVAHSHIRDDASRTSVRGRTLNGLVVGCYQDYINDWAGNIGHMWWSGLTLLDNAEDGNFDPSFIRLDTLKKMYGSTDTNANSPQ